MPTRDEYEKLRTPGRAQVPDIPPQDADHGDGESDSAGRWGKFQTYGCQLIQADRRTKTFLYGAVAGSLEFDPGGRITFRFEDHEGKFDVTIEGSNLQSVFDHLSDGKRLSIRVNVQRTSIGRVPQQSDGKPVVERISYQQVVEDDE